MIRAVMSAARIAALAAFGFSVQAAGAAAQEGASGATRENVMKACGDKWRAVRDAETAKGVTWPQFLSGCRASTAAAARAPSPASAATSQQGTSQQGTSQQAGAQPSAAQAVAAAPGPAATPARNGPVFPDIVSPRHSSERPALARQRTCADQFRANKAAAANGGLRWIERGGGYWSQCNAHLKQTRA